MESKSVARGVVYGGVASCSAEVVTMPVDVVKTRLQMDGAGAARRYRGSLHCAAELVRAQGPRALFAGLSPALLRQSTYGSMRYGLYAPIRNALGAGDGSGGSALWQKVVAGAAAGALASGIATPTDLIKVRMQTEDMAAAAGGRRGRYEGVWQCFRVTLREEGVRALWTGVGPTMGRATALAAAELSTYDEVKAQLRRRGVFETDGLPLHAATAFVSGVAASAASSPFDVVRSRVMGQPVDAAGVALLYRGPLDCAAKLVRREGVLALYRGFLPNLARIVPRVTIIFVVLERLKGKFG